MIPHPPKILLISLAGNHFSLEVLFILGPFNFKHPSSFRCSQREMNRLGHTRICPEDAGTELHLLLEMGADQPSSRQDCHYILKVPLLKQSFSIHCRPSHRVGSLRGLQSIKMLIPVFAPSQVAGRADLPQLALLVLFFLFKKYI